VRVLFLFAALGDSPVIRRLLLVLFTGAHHAYGGVFDKEKILEETFIVI